MTQFQIFYFLLTIAQIPLATSLNNVQNDKLTVNSDNVIMEKHEPDYFTGFSLQGLQKSLKKNSICKNHVDLVLHHAKNLDLWALKMLDASAKLPSGILSGNLNQFGDFDECLASGTSLQNHVIKGKYCLVNIEHNVRQNETNEKLKHLNRLIHSNWMLKNSLKDQGHRIPKFETFKWGVCTPESCTNEEIQEAFRHQLSEKNTYFYSEVSLDPEACYTNETESYTIIKLGVQFWFLLLLIVIVLGTLNDYVTIKVNNPSMIKVLQSFSLKRNLQLLLKTEFAKDDIRCIHGARFLHAIALLLSHKQIAMLFNPISNRTEMTDAFSKSWTMIGRSAILYTDSFIMFSGLLASYSLVKDLDIKKKTAFKSKLINRILRLIPNLFGVIFFCTFIMGSMSSGPQWGLVVNKYTSLCKKYMWRNFLFIHNYFGFENMCLTHTHQLGIDMQLYLLSPLFIYALWKSPFLGSVVTIAFSIMSTGLRYFVTYKESLSTLLYYGISVEQLWKTANTSYILPTHRLTVYLIGILLGYYLRRGGKQMKLSGSQVLVGWAAAIGAGLLAVFWFPEAASKNYVYSPKEAAIFNAFAPVFWITFISWAVLACESGYGGLLNKLLSSKYFIIFTRISYAFYLTQFPVFFYNVGSLRTVEYYKGFQSLVDVSEYCVILIASVVLTLTFDIPFQKLRENFSQPSSPDHALIKAKKDGCDTTEENQTKSRSFGL